MSHKIDIVGPAAPDGRNSNIRIIGDLSGSLLADVFGNVTILGSFSGQIGDAGTLAGAGNRLQITVPGGGGALLPNDDIFATRIGYP